MKCKRFVWGILLWISILASYAQKVDKAGLLSVYDKQFEFLDSLLKQQFADPCVPLQDFTTDFNSLSECYAAFEGAVNRKTRANILVIRNQTGLQWSNNYYNRIVPYRLYQLIDDDGDFSMVKVRFQTDLNWDLINCGLLWGKSKIAAHKLDAEMTLADAKINMQNSYIERLTTENVQRYQQALALLRSLRLQNLLLLEQTEAVLFENQQSGTDKLLEIMGEFFSIGQLQSVDSNSFQSLSGLAYQVIDTVALNTNLFLEAIRSKNYELVKLDLGFKRIGTQIKQTSFWNSVTLAPFIRFGIYGMIDNRRQGSIDMGVNFRMPLSFEQSKSRKALVADQQILIAKRDLSYHFFQEEVSRLVQELSQLNKKMVYEHQRIQEMRKLLLSRSEAFRNLYGEYSRPDRIREYNRYIACLETIVQLKYQRNVILIDLQRYLHDEKISSFINYIQSS